MNQDELDRWITLLNRLCGPVLEPLDHDEQLRDALSKPDSLAGPLIAYCLSPDRRAAHISKRAASDVKTAEPAPLRSRLVREAGRLADVAMWWALFDPQLNVAQFTDLDADGPLFDPQIGRTFATIEVWTETELAGLHALWHHAQLDQRHAADSRQRMVERITRTVHWHIENTQPDNATCHPWAVHVFLLHGTPESQHFAETQVSNCLVSNAKPDVLSAWILRDAAEGLTMARS
ncbi:MAG: hypothetical protein D8M59_07865 [Planctomycetes bacterium]|nr:hypothetical protein [Planctomycetota bacterium]NOG53240.1 hypothetical protein [Planctomycetota bacterium]